MVRHDHEGQAAAKAQGIEKLLERLETAGRAAEPDDPDPAGRRRRWTRLRGVRLGWRSEFGGRLCAFDHDSTLAIGMEWDSHRYSEALPFRC
jgi:hypothetical protein